MTPEEAYAEARRRIREAKKTGALELYLRGLALNRLPRELARRANRHLARSRHLRQALGSGIQGDGAGLYAPWKRGPQALQGDEAMAQRSRRYARIRILGHRQRDIGIEKAQPPAPRAPKLKQTGGR